MSTLIILYRFGYEIETFKDESVAGDTFRQRSYDPRSLHVCLYGSDGEVVMQSGVKSAL